ncbi:MAG: NAD-dependent epimerase/dehydratase family protein, partial [Candidatus Binatota bacterium]
MIMITGGLGFFGANLAKLLCDAGERVLLTSNRNLEVPPLLAPFVDKNLKITPLDITSFENISRAVVENLISEEILHQEIERSGLVRKVAREQIDSLRTVLHSAEFRRDF